MPLLPLHLLWINLVTDALPALALVTDPTSPDVMKRPPRAPSEPLLARREWSTLAVTGALQTLIVVGVFVWAVGLEGLQPQLQHEEVTPCPNGP